MSLPHIAVRASVVAVLACGCPSPPPSPIGVWRHPPSHTQEMRLTFSPAGKLEFSGGFLFYNPSSWRYDPHNQELHIKLGGTMPLGSSHQYQLENRPHTLRAVEAETRTLVYPFDESNKSLDFGGYVFFREAASDTRAAP